MSLISGSDWSFVILLLIVILSALTLMVISCMVRRETTTMAKTTEISNKILQVSIVFIAPSLPFLLFTREFFAICIHSMKNQFHALFKVRHIYAVISCFCVTFQ